MSSAYGQNNRTLNLDTLFVRDIVFKDFANNPIPANQPFVSRGDGGTYFTSSMTSTFASPAVNAIIASTSDGGNYQYVASSPYNVFNFESGGSTEFYSNSSNGGLIIYNTGPEQIIADGQVLPFAILPDYTVGGRTLQYVGTGDTTLQVSDATIFFNSIYYSSVSTVLFLQSTSIGLENELTSSISELNILLTSSGIYNYNLISSYFLTPNVINISTVSTSLLVLGDNTIQDNPLRDTIYDPCIVVTGSTILSTNTDFLTFTDNFSGVTFAIDKEYLYGSSTMLYGDSTITVTRGQQVQLGWFPTLSTQTDSQSLRAQFVPIIQQIQVMEQLISTSTEPIPLTEITSTITNYYMKNIGRFDEICNPNKISLISPVIAATLRNDNTGYANSLSYITGTGEIVYDTTKTFVINHPKDESKYLVHACLEGPEAGVYYRGTGTIAELETSVDVELPDYVDALAVDLTVQVTPIYNGAVRILNASCVSNNKFTVYGDSGDFHWHVYGRRLSVVVEPKKSDVDVRGEGPYRWIV
jgi:hypothetical protein